MAKRLYHMSWAEVQAEMSICGSPEKMTALGKKIMGIIWQSLDPTNGLEFVNAEFMLQRIIAEIRGAKRRYDKAHQVKIR